MFRSLIGPQGSVCERHQQWASPDRTSPGMFEAKLVFLSMLAERHSAQSENFCRGFRWMDIDNESDQVP